MLKLPRHGSAPPVVEGRDVANLRSFWSESILLAVIQQEALNDFAGRLGAAGADPARREVADAYAEWLAFRNTVWWSAPSIANSPPRILVRMHRTATGSAATFAELEGDFASYVNEYRRRTAAAETSALENIQVYGAAVAVAGAAAALVSVWSDVGGGFGAKLLALLLIAVAAVAASLVARAALQRGRAGS